MVVPSPTPKTKLLCEYFFKKIDSHGWQSKECLKTKSKRGGWTNLLSHLRLCVEKDYEQAIVDHQKMIASTSTAAGYILQISKHEKEVCNWINFIVMKNLPVSFADCPYTCNITRLTPISAQMLRCHILALFSVVKETIKAELPTKFSIVVFDGWTEGTHHCIGIAMAGRKEPITALASQQLSWSLATAVRKNLCTQCYQCNPWL